MKAETKEWVAKVEGDFHDMLCGIRARKNPNLDRVCRHAEQCIEKYLYNPLMSVKNICRGKNSYIK
jgi:hypothetical protein